MTVVVAVFEALDAFATLLEGARAGFAVVDVDFDEVAFAGLGGLNDERLLNAGLGGIIGLL